jgi:peroxiredoxin
LIFAVLIPVALLAQQNKGYETPKKFNLSPQAIQSKQNNGFEVTGRMEGLKEGEKVMLGLYENGRDNIDDSAYVMNGEFHIKGSVSEGPRYYNLTFEQHPAKVVRLFIENEDKISVKSRNIEKIPHNYLDNYISVEGSRANFTYHRFIPVLEVYSQTNKRLDADHYLKEIKDSVGFDPSLVAGVLAAKDQMNQALYYMNFYKPDTGYISLATIPYLVKISGMNTDGKHPAILREIYEQLDERVKNTYHGKELKEVTALCVGAPFPPFKLPNPEGQMISSEEVIKKSKITLVQFWAITSYQRAQFQEELKVMYQKYHDKGLNIIGVASDTTDYMWKGFVNAQKFPWYNVSDLKGANGVVGKIYKEYGSPGMENTTNVLIDHEGKIIAWDAYGAELQYYLWEFFKE